MRRTVFFISDGTAITTETVGHSLLTQFPGVTFRQFRIPFVDNPEKARDAVARIDRACAEDGAPAIVFISIIDDRTRSIFSGSRGITLDLFADFLNTLEKALDVGRQSSVGRAHGVANSDRYEDRMEATNYALTHDDGMSLSYANADLILVGISRTGKTPTCLYMAMQYGVFAANYPLTEEEFESGKLPAALDAHRDKLFGLTINARRLQQIRRERMDSGRYSTAQQVGFELREAEKLFRKFGITFIDTTEMSVEEIASTILEHTGLERRFRP